MSLTKTHRIALRTTPDQGALFAQHAGYAQTTGWVRGGRTTVASKGALQDPAHARRMPRPSRYAGG